MKLQNVSEEEFVQAIECLNKSSRGDLVSDAELAAGLKVEEVLIAFFDGLGNEYGLVSYRLLHEWHRLREMAHFRKIQSNSF